MTHLKTDAGHKAVESLQLYGSNKVSNGALDIKLNPTHPI